MCGYQNNAKKKILEKLWILKKIGKNFGLGLSQEKILEEMWSPQKFSKKILHRHLHALATSPQEKLFINVDKNPIREI